MKASPCLSGSWNAVATQLKSVSFWTEKNLNILKNSLKGTTQKVLIENAHNGRLENYLINNHGYDYEYLIDLMISRFGFSKEDYDDAFLTVNRLIKMYHNDMDKLHELTNKIKSEF